MTDTAVLADIIVIGFFDSFGGGGGGGGGSGGQPLSPAAFREDTLERLERTYPESCGQKDKEEFRADAGFIAQAEGQNRSSGYIPLNPNGTPVGDSGVTIGIGVDLGARNAADLNSLQLLPALKNILTPYLGLKGTAAVAYLNAHPLTLTAGQLSQLNNRVHQQIYSRIQRRFDAGSSMSFWRLPAAVQTVALSVLLQHGENSSPTFFGHLMNGRWSSAVSELRNFGDNHPTRRNAEADILQAAIDNGEIPNQC